ncbi:MAG: hypothetical protein JWN08_2128, partial [Frankiales bacterium]|nr:hypothetical protein [Frankiales bacterium]
MTPAPAPSADPGLTGLVGVARELYGADSACLVLVDVAGGQRTLVACGSPDGVADEDLVARVVAEADVVAAVDRPELPVGSWAGAPLLDPTGRVIGVLAISTSRPDPLPQDRLSGLRVVAEAVLARLDQLVPVPAPAAVRPTRTPERSPGPGAALVDRDRLLRTADSALAELRSCGEGSAAALVLTVQPGRSPLPSDIHGADLVRRLRAQLRPGDLL